MHLFNMKVFVVFMLNRFFLFIALIVVPILFSGCSSSLKQTSVEGLCGSCKPYYVRGSWHYPQTHYEYDEEGLASWYGPRFHGKPKPMGEKFNQHAMTAAHKTLPLPTIAKVTNLENGKSVVVLIDDRGPFVYDGRIIDLSMEAAKQLGSYQKGTARVRVQALVEESKALAEYLAKYGHHMKKDRLKRTWLQIYEQEINGGNHLGDGPAPSFHEGRGKHNPQKPKFQSVSYRDFNDSPKIVRTADYNKTIHKSKKVVSAGKKYVTLDENFSKKEEAMQKLKKINKKYPAKIIQKVTPKGKSIWKIRVGPVSDTMDTNVFKK